MTRLKPKASIVLFAAAAVLAASVSLTVALQPAQSATARSLTVLNLHENKFYNYDFTQKTVSATKVDWPINLVFQNNAEIDKIKRKMRPWLPHNGGTMYGRINDGNGWLWDEDKGMKSKSCPNVVTGAANHARLYADKPGGDRMYDRFWRFFVLASSHRDHNECPVKIGAWFGESEKAEGWIADRARSAFGSSRVHEDAFFFHNREPYRKRDNHAWENDGYTTRIEVP